MAIFGPKPWVNPFGKMSIFRLLELLVFIAQKGVFSIQNLEKSYLPNLQCLKKKMSQKWPYLDQNHGLTLCKKVNFTTFGTFCLYCLERRFFVLDHRKSYFPNQYCLTKKVGKMAIFGSKPWVNPFGKSSIFRQFELLLFIAQKGVFSF